MISPLLFFFKNSKNKLLGRFKNQTVRIKRLKKHCFIGHSSLHLRLILLSKKPPRRANRCTRKDPREQMTRALAVCLSRITQRNNNRKKVKPLQTHYSWLLPEAINRSFRNTKLLAKKKETNPGKRTRNFFLRVDRGCGHNAPVPL